MTNLNEIGILGGGQLARMTIEAAMQLGVRCHVLDKAGDVPAAAFTYRFTAGNPQDFDTVMQFVGNLPAVTIDSEHVNAQALTALEAEGRIVAPQGRVLEIIQNKCRQKEFIERCGFPTAKFQVARNREELTKMALAYPVVQKTATSGYDGYGVKVLESEADLQQAFEAESVIEEKIAIAKEIAVIVASDRTGNRVAYDAVEMVFDKKRNILKYQLCPAETSAEIATRATELALSAAKSLGIVGLLAVEMFLTEKGELLINEMAPRPHNSGHHTIEAAATSQYENLVRILTDLPLGSPETTAPSLMINLLGPQSDKLAQWNAMIEKALRMPNAHVHLYGKRDMRPFRKLGHITLVGERNTLIRQYETLTWGS
ncbi:MAG: 5-(carboxyamino)imidazole ribonucleotide synthase [Turneriella sp.]